MECNPATLTAEKLAAYRKAGINRLSMGVQSMEPSVLSIMGRAHGPEDVISNFRLAREAGFDNINLDVMFGVPGQDMEIWKDTVHKVLALEPEHLSFYSLELAEGTEFYRRLAGGLLKETAPEADREMYHWILEELDQAGYEHYEISNAAKAGRQCRHNLKYWNLEDYLGLGAAAHSFIVDKRFSNAENVHRYIEALQEKRLPVDWHQENTWEDSLTDYIFTALRKTKGIGKKDFEGRFGREFWNVFADRKAEFETYVAAGDAAEDEEAVWITRKGMDIASEIIALFL
jgi:oxygen-independent coproporphyrinogen-3 oxidase